MRIKGQRAGGHAAGVSQKVTGAEIIATLKGIVNAARDDVKYAYGDGRDAIAQGITRLQERGNERGLLLTSVSDRVSALSDQVSALALAFDDRSFEASLRGQIAQVDTHALNGISTAAEGARLMHAAAESLEGRQVALESAVRGLADTVARLESQLAALQATVNNSAKVISDFAAASTPARVASDLATKARTAPPARRISADAGDNT